jgi:hypothetical protein
MPTISMTHAQQTDGQGGRVITGDDALCACVRRRVNGSGSALGFRRRLYEAGFAWCTAKLGNAGR